ncbi:MAG: sigma-70 family RNA polymerase sigma factor [Acidimicrobiales bacterium]|nr:sigma-70 family RNA polymerase sigma factor [Acidimicrobiales bacterium]
MERTSLDDTLSAARAGEGWAFDALFKKWNGPLTGFVRARGSSDVEAVVNDVFLKAFNALGTFEGDASGFRAWLFRIARNRVIDEFRASGRRPTVVGLDPGFDAVGGDVSSDADRRFGDQRVVQLLSQLTDEQREVLTLRLVADLTIDQIASITGRRRGAVKQLQRRALRRLEAIIDESEGDV